ncbi:MAG: class I SAM-dependent methyltransferase [Pseudomonadota bacterium]
MSKNAADILAERREIWKSKEVIRRLYYTWYRLIANALRRGKTLELGGGSGNLKEFLPDAITSDVIFAPWLDAVLDAHGIPFKKSSLENIVLFDVLHHLKAPAVFFREAERVLRPGGRIVLVEPYVSWLSFFVYRFLHQEGMDWWTDPLKMKHPKNNDPFHGNQAIPTLIFEKHLREFKRMFPHLRIILKKKTDSLIYPLSGGFHHPSLCPLFLTKALEYMEDLMQPICRFTAFRLFLVLEKS